LAAVTTQLPHTKLLNAAAREVLRPLGIKQMGRSRTWLDDRGWWVGVVDFQPSSWSRGSYLNVGVNWLWQAGEDAADLALHFGGRVDAPHGGGFIGYESDQQFGPLARKLAMAAAERAQHYRALFPTIEATATVLKRYERQQSILESIDTGIALGLVGAAGAAQRMFARYIAYHESGEDLEWRTEIDEMRYDRAQQLSELLSDVASFRERIRRDIEHARSQLLLGPDVELPF
jgi:hypothetical protein